jgi:EAL domain-containing protein (putative c-di-GMP-specific phosphodiesterase class I)
MLDRTQEQAMEQAESIRSDIEQSPVSIENDKVSFTVSIGVCALEDYTASVEMAMEHASLAVKEAKAEGRNTVVLYKQDSSRASEYKDEQAATIASIEETLNSKNFVLQAQPIAKAISATGQTHFDHYEVLLALEDETGRLSSPQDFINQAERFGYMTEVDRWVVKHVFIWICEMMDELKVVPNLSINLSGNSITDDKFMEYLFEEISEYGVGTNKICFEITETGSISNMVKATDFVNEFKNIGCKFSIDDFGTGLASHSYLRELPVDYVKIDGTFITNIHNSPKDYAMAKSINDLAHFLGQETIAEFAESEEIIEKLREMGVDYVQGWGVGKPTPLTVLAGQLESLEK